MCCPVRATGKKRTRSQSFKRGIDVALTVLVRRNTEADLERCREIAEIVEAPRLLCIAHRSVIHRKVAAPHPAFFAPTPDPRVTPRGHRQTVYYRNHCAPKPNDMSWRHTIWHAQANREKGKQKSRLSIRTDHKPALKNKNGCHTMLKSPCLVSRTMDSLMANQ